MKDSIDRLIEAIQECEHLSTQKKRGLLLNIGDWLGNKAWDESQSLSREEQFPSYEKHPYKLMADRVVAAAQPLSRP